MGNYTVSELVAGKYRKAKSFDDREQAKEFAARLPGKTKIAVKPFVLTEYEPFIKDWENGISQTWNAIAPDCGEIKKLSHVVEAVLDRVEELGNLPPIPRAKWREMIRDYKFNGRSAERLASEVLGGYV